MIDTPPGARRAARRSQRGWLFASAVALPYFITSLVVVLNSVGNANGTVWLPTFPDAYYAATRLLYLPFDWYFEALRPLQANPDIAYSTFALISRAPFLLLPLVVFGVTAGRMRRSRGKKPLAGGRALVVLALVLAVAVYAGVQPVRRAVDDLVALLDPRDISRLREYLLSLGPWAPLVSFLLMVLQSVAAPLPAFVITLANGLVFGAFWGGVLSWTSAMAGAALCYYIARAMGRPAVERLAGGGALAKTDAIFERYGSQAVLIARLVPVISFDVVSYAAGLTRIRIVPFLLATGLGQLPATVVYSVLGENISGGVQAGLWALGALVSLVVVGAALRGRLERQVSGRRSGLVEGAA